MGRVKRIWYLSPMRAAKVQASLRIRAVSPEPPLLAHTSSESRGTFRQKARSLAPLNGWACAVKICHDGMLEDTNSLDAVHITVLTFFVLLCMVLVLNISEILTTVGTASVRSFLVFAAMMTYSGILEIMIDGSEPQSPLDTSACIWSKLYASTTSRYLNLMTRWPPNCWFVNLGIRSREFPSKYAAPSIIETLWLST